MDIGLIFLAALGVALVLPYWAYYRQPLEYRQKQESEMITVPGGAKMSRMALVFTVLLGIILIFLLIQFFAGIKNITKGDLIVVSAVFIFTLIVGKIFHKRYSEQHRKFIKIGQIFLATVLFIELILFFLR